MAQTALSYYLDGLYRDIYSDKNVIRQWAQVIFPLYNAVFPVDDPRPAEPTHNEYGEVCP